MHHDDKNKFPSLFSSLYAFKFITGINIAISIDFEVEHPILNLKINKIYKIYLGKGLKSAPRAKH